MSSSKVLYEALDALEDEIKDHQEQVARQEYEYMQQIAEMKAEIQRKFQKEEEEWNRGPYGRYHAK